MIAVVNNHSLLARQAKARTYLSYLIAPTNSAFAQTVKSRVWRSITITVSKAYRKHNTWNQDSTRTCRPEVPTQRRYLLRLSHLEGGTFDFYCLCSCHCTPKPNAVHCLFGHWYCWTRSHNSWFIKAKTERFDHWSSNPDSHKPQLVYSDSCAHTKQEPRQLRIKPVDY